MRTLIYLVLTLAPAACLADTFILKDGGRLEGEVTGEMDGVLMIKTRYGALTVNESDIQERKASPAPQVTVSTAAAPVIKTEALPALPPSPQVLVSSPAAQEPAAEPAPRLTFATVEPSTSSRLLVYSESGVVIATETFDASGALVSLEGAVKDGTYTEYYPDGALKTVKSMLGGKASGTLKTFYPGAGMQVEAYYMGGVKEGPFRYYTADGKLLMEAEYRGDRLNGWKKEYGPDGAVRAQAYYQDDQPAEPPAPKAEAAPAAAERDTMISARVQKIARGENLSFQLNGKYVGKARLDKDYNLIGLEGSLPDGAVKVYTKDGKLEKELVFGGGELKTLRVYEPGGPLKAEYGYVKDKAVKK
jgi:antitoxin component YwqK of YwqJK toxin-antitoxin module